MDRCRPGCSVHVPFAEQAWPASFGVVDAFPKLVCLLVFLLNLERGAALSSTRYLPVFFSVRPALRGIRGCPRMQAMAPVRCLADLRCRRQWSSGFPRGFSTAEVRRNCPNEELLRGTFRRPKTVMDGSMFPFSWREGKLVFEKSSRSNTTHPNTATCAT